MSKAAASKPAKPQKPTAEPKAGKGRPAHKPDDKSRGMVKALAAAGYDHDRIALYMKISAPTLAKHYKAELETAVMELLGGAVSGLAEALKKQEPWAICFVLKTRGKKLHNGEGWSERQEVTGPEGGAIPIRLGSLNDSQLSQLLERLERGLATLPA